MWAAIIALIGKLLGWLTRKDERDISHDQGEKLGVSETQAATAQAAVQEANDAARVQDGVDGLSRQQLADGLREYANPEDD